MVKPGQPQPAYRIVRNPAFKHVDPDADADADDEAAEEAQKLKPGAPAPKPVESPRFAFQSGG